MVSRHQIFKVDYHQVVSMLTAQEVAARLGVKLDTVYAYVSRGALSAHHESGTRQSLFAAEDVEALARRGRPRRGSRPAALDLVVETGLTTIADDQLRFRGRDARTLARTSTFEQAAHWLWTGQEEPASRRWEPYPVTLPELEFARDRVRVTVIMASTHEPLRYDLSPSAVIASAERMIATMVSTVAATEATPAELVLDGDGPTIAGTIAGHLWPRLSPKEPTPGLVATLNAALVLLADHELESSTVAARVAASVRSNPFSVVIAGLGVIAGPLHGAASTLVHRMLADAIDRGPRKALAAALEAQGQLPGFGQRLYPSGDPRAKLLLPMIDAASPPAAIYTAAHDLIDTAWRHSRLQPNADFALGYLSTVAQMPATAGETIFTIARTAGWIAHAIEEYAEPPLRFRARAVYRQPQHSVQPR